MHPAKGVYTMYMYTSEVVVVWHNLTCNNNGASWQLFASSNTEYDRAAAVVNRHLVRARRVPTH